MGDVMSTSASVPSSASMFQRLKATPLARECLLFPVVTSHRRLICTWYIVWNQRGFLLGDQPESLTDGYYSRVNCLAINEAPRHRE